jgi:rubrerythrin
MEIMAALEGFRALERRGIEFYGKLAERFGTTRGGRLWRECANTEASHHAIFMLCLDWAHMWRWTGPKPEVPVEPADLAREEAALVALETEAGRGDLGEAAALDLALSWEERELSRVLFITPHAPGRGKGQLLAMVKEAEEHYNDLEQLAREIGCADDTARLARIDTLRARVREASA